MRNEPHYCRECGELFPSVARGGVTPHTQVWKHMREEHGENSEYRFCSKHCERRAQPEERTTGKRLYGKGIPKPEVELIDRYNLLFPRDNV